MSRSEIERFVADLNANASLRATAQKLQPDGSSGLPLDAVVSFATSRGYAVTTEAVIAFAKSAKAGAHGSRMPSSTGLPAAVAAAQRSIPASCRNGKSFRSTHP